MTAYLLAAVLATEWQPVEISVYSKRYHGRRTASGERYDHYKGLTGATTYRNGRWTLPKGSVWEIEYPAGRVVRGGQKIVFHEDGSRWFVVTVRINDTGSHRPTKAPVWVDLSGNAWRTLTGIAPSRKVARMRRVK